MNLVEQFVLAKSQHDEACEDGVVLTDGFAAVIDGATDKTGRRYHGVAGGRFVMVTCKGVLATLNPDADALAAAGQLAQRLADLLPNDLSDDERPSAAIAIYSASRREVWQVGDVGFWHSGLRPGGQRTRSTVDGVASAMRAAVLTAELIRGTDTRTLATVDPGRNAILPLLARQGIFCNDLRAGIYAYGAIDGRSVPQELITIHKVPHDVTELVLASDGYPCILPTLRESELRLAELLRDDPLCIGPLQTTKGLAPEARSFDDRAYLRFMLD